MKRALAILAACGGGSHLASPDASAPADAESDAASDYAWNLPTGFPTPLVPADNPMSADKVELGRRLFYDTRLSGNQTYSCASCHDQANAFTDRKTVAIGSTGEMHPRNSMSLTNVAYLGRFAWGNPLLSELEQQAVIPMFGFQPVELGMRNMEDQLVDRLTAEPIYADLFRRSFPGDDAPISVANTVKAISAFERTLISGDSPFDRWQRGDATAISDSAQRGYELFTSEKCECFHCHAGFNFEDVVKYQGKSMVEARFHNTGLYNIDGMGAYPAPNTGIHEVSGIASDMGKFRAPTLRNVAVTAPYFHDGSAATLDEVLDHYAAAGRTIPSGPYAGVGSANPYKDSLIIGFTLSDQERADLKAFFESLTDATFLHDSRFADPW